MNYYKSDYAGEKGTVEVFIAASNANVAQTLLLNYVENFLIPHYGPSTQEPCFFKMDRDEYWTAKHHEGAVGGPRFIGP